MTIELEQGTPEWKAARLGYVTASCVVDVMAKGKKGEVSITREKYKMRLVAERLSEQSEDSFTNAAMAWGNEQEPIAAMRYEAQQGVFVDKVGFCTHPTIKWLGVSPDRLVGDDGLIEIKCPNTTTHLDYCLTKVVPTKYYSQMQCQMYVTGRKWCDFVSFDPRLKNQNNQLLIIRVEADAEFIQKMESAVVEFLDEVEVLTKKLEGIQNVSK